LKAANFRAPLQKLKGNLKRRFPFFVVYSIVNKAYTLFDRTVSLYNEFQNNSLHSSQLWHGSSTIAHGPDDTVVPNPFNIIVAPPYTKEEGS